MKKILFFMIVLMTFLYIPASVVSAAPAAHTITYYMKYAGKTVEYKKVKTHTGARLKALYIPDKAGVKPDAWTVKINGAAKKLRPYSTFQVKGDMKLYAEYKSLCTVTYYKSNKQKIKEVIVKKGTTIKLYAMRNTSKYMFIGWTNTSDCEIPCDKVYAAGTNYKVNGNRKFYQVLYAKKDSAKSITTMKKIKSFAHTIIIGDSRMEHTKRIFQSEGGIPSNVTIYAKGGKGLTYFQENWYEQIMKQISKINGKIAVVFQIGINDIYRDGKGTEYVEFLNDFAKKISSSRVKVFWMTANPINSAQMRWWKTQAKGNVDRNEMQLQTFNNQLKKELSNKIIRIDTCSYLMKNGYVTANLSDAAKDDGLHYDIYTYKKIWNYMVNILNRY